MTRLSLRCCTLLALVVFLLGCPPLIGPYSPTAYENATSLKAEVVAILDRADTPFAENEASIDAVRLKIEQAYEYVRGVPNNQLSAKQWAILKDPDGDLLGKFFKRWEERGSLSAVLKEEYKKLAAEAFDEIICLEANKKKQSECVSAGGVGNV